MLNIYIIVIYLGLTSCSTESDNIQGYIGSTHRTKNDESESDAQGKSLNPPSVSAVQEPTHNFKKILIKKYFGSGSENVVHDVPVVNAYPIEGIVTDECVGLIEDVKDYGTLMIADDDEVSTVEEPGDIQHKSASSFKADSTDNFQSITTTMRSNPQKDDRLSFSGDQKASNEKSKKNVDLQNQQGQKSKIATKRKSSDLHNKKNKKRKKNVARNSSDLIEILLRARKWAKNINPAIQNLVILLFDHIAYVKVGSDLDSLKIFIQQFKKIFNQVVYPRSIKSNDFENCMETLRRIFILPKDIQHKKNYSGSTTSNSDDVRKLNELSRIQFINCLKTILNLQEIYSFKPNNSEPFDIDQNIINEFFSDLLLNKKSPTKVYFDVVRNCRFIFKNFKKFSVACIHRYLYEDLLRDSLVLTYFPELYYVFFSANTFYKTQNTVSCILIHYEIIKKIIPIYKEFIESNNYDKITKVQASAYKITSYIREIVRRLLTSRKPPITGTDKKIYWTRNHNMYDVTFSNQMYKFSQFILKKEFEILKKNNISTLFYGEWPELQNFIFSRVYHPDQNILQASISNDESGHSSNQHENPISNDQSGHSSNQHENPISNDQSGHSSNFDNHQKNGSSLETDENKKTLRHHYLASVSLQMHHMLFCTNLDKIDSSDACFIMKNMYRLAFDNLSISDDALLASIYCLSAFLFKRSR